MTKRHRYATRDELVELLAARVHDGWMANKREQGTIAEWDHEFMVPYAELSEKAKDIDRDVARFVLDGLAELGASVDFLVKITVTESL